MVQIKGIKEGLLVTLGEGDWKNLQAQLLEYVANQSAFFKGAKVALDIGNQILHAAEMGLLRDRLSEHGIQLWAVISNSPTTEQTAQMLGLATRLGAPRTERIAPRVEAIFGGEPAVVLNRTLRSGYRIEIESHVVVLGDVNPGAEVVSAGSVIVWGKLKGSVQAGVSGKEDVVVCALEMTPLQLRIANEVLTLPHRKGKLQPEMARIHKGTIILENWNNKEGGK